MSCTHRMAQDVSVCVISSMHEVSVSFDLLHHLHLPSLIPHQPQAVPATLQLHRGEVRSCLISNVCAKGTCPFPPPLVALSLRSVVVPVFVDVTTDSHVHLFFFCGMWWTAVDCMGSLCARMEPPGFPGRTLRRSGGTFLSLLWRKLWRQLVWIGCHCAFVPTESLLLGFRRVPLLIYVCFPIYFPIAAGFDSSF